MPRRPKPPLSSLTAQQERILNYIAAFAGSEGRPPSLEEIRKHLRLAAVSTVHEHIGRLVDKGYLSRRWNRSYSIEMAAGSRRWARLVPLAGSVAAGQPLEPPNGLEEIAVPADLVAAAGDFAVSVVDGSFGAHGILAGDTLVISTVAERLGEHALTLATAGDGGVVLRRAGDRDAGRETVGVGAEAPGAPGLRVLGRVVGLLRRYRE
jgi:repressor LexA